MTATRKREPQEWIIQSNEIEEVYDPEAHALAQKAFDEFLSGPFSLKRIRDCHKTLYGMFDPEIAGVWRKFDVQVGARICPSWWAVPHLMRGWLSDHRMAKTAEEIKQAHIFFEKVHPFGDGNGRVGRMILNYQRVKAGLEPLLIKKSERWEYYEWFQESR